MGVKVRAELWVRTHAFLCGVQGESVSADSMALKGYEPLPLIIWLLLEASLVLVSCVLRYSGQNGI